MTHLYFIRHGQALTEVDGIANDYGLTELGVKQAERLRDRLAATGEITADILIASTFPRARQTAEIIAPALGLPIIFDDEVQEQRPGSAIGMRTAELRELARDQRPKDDPFAIIVPGAESWAQFVLRVETALHRIIQQYEGKTVVIVCHGGVIDNTFTYFFGLGGLHQQQVRFFTQNTSITHWRSRKKGSSQWRLVYYNDHFHLRDLDTPGRIPWQELRSEERIEKDDQPIIAPSKE
jgi:2,3-bisphosphoglycerate-dependent phosphoglycerate mutase